MKKRCMSILLAFCMAWTLFPASTLAETSDGDAVPIIAEADATSTDETSAESAVLSDAGDAMTRGAWMREMVNLFGLTLNKDEYPDVYFPDIAESEYFDDIMVATKFGLADVEAGDNFEPDAPLTRDFAAHTLNFYLGIQNDRESYTYSDADSVVWRDDAQVAVDNGWLALSDGKFAPASDVTAEETATMLSFATETLNGRKADESVANYAFSSYVKELPSDAEIKSTLDIDSGVTTLEISGYSGTLAANDTIVFYSDGFAFVYGVASVTESDGVLTVVTKEAPDDAIEQFEQVGETQPELEPYLPEDNEPVSLMAADGEMVTFDRVELLDAGKHKISYKRDFNKNGLSGKLSAEVTDISLKTNFIGDKRYVTLSGKITLSSTMELDFLNDDAAAQLFLGGIYIGKFGTLGLEINLKAAASIAYEYSAKFTVGVESLNGSKSLIHQLSASDTCITAKGTVSAKLALAARLEFGKVAKFYAGIGIGPTLSAKFKQYPSGTPQRCINLAGYLAADMEISAKLGKLKYEYTKDIYSESNSPLRVVEHIEDGVTVPACTRGKDSGTEESGYATPKYTTPTNSRYYASGVSNVSSTGYGGYSSTEPVVIWQTSDNGDGTVTITGYSGNASILNIPETIDGKTVTAIGHGAFQNNQRIRILTFPNTIITICSDAFRNCTAITEANLPEGLTSLGRVSPSGNGSGQLGRAFSGCTSLQKVYIPSTLEECHYQNFEGCTKLHAVEFGEGITQICDNLFANCPGISDITIPDTVTGIGKNAFSGCANLKSISIPDFVTFLAHGAFSSCTALTDVKFGTSLSHICSDAFRNCTSLVEANLPDGLVSLGRVSPSGNGSGQLGRAFSGCTSLQKVYIPSTLEECHYQNFEGCTELHTVEFGDNTTQICAYLFANCPGISDIIIPDTVTGIGENAFSGCVNLKSISIPDFVTFLAHGAFSSCTALTNVKFGTSLSHICSDAFRNCTSLVEANLPNGLISLGRVSPSGSGSGQLGRAFSGCTSLQKVYIPSTLEECHYQNFEGCTKLHTVEFGEGITQICDNLFAGCPGTFEVTLPDTITKIGNSSFYASGLKSISFPDTVTSYGTSSLKDCMGLISVRLSVNSSTIPASMFSGCSSLESIEVPNGVAEIQKDTFNGCSSLKSVTLPNTVTKIENNAFKGCAALTDLTWLSNAVASIGNNAFENCTGLTNAMLPDLVSSLGGSTFKGCTSLTSFKGGANLQTVGANCFQDCTALTNVEFANGLTSIGNYAFQNCAALETIVLPDSVTSIGTYAFQKDAALKNVTLSSGLTQIPSYAFANCTSMTELEIPSGVTTIKDHAFYQDTKLKTFVIPASVGKIEDNAFSYPTTTTVYGVPGSYAETYAKWAAFLDIAQYRKTGTMGDAQELQWTYDPGGKTVTVTGAVNASAPVYVGSYDANGKMLSVKLITASNGAAQADDGANTVMLFWLDSNFMPKCGKATIRNA